MNRNRPLLPLLAATLIALGSFPCYGFAQEKDPTLPNDPGLMMTTDLALARPVGAAATVTGFALFLVSSPFSLLGGNAGEAWNNLVAAPASYTFKRPLGHFDQPDPKTLPPKSEPLAR
ncbi:MAG: hypothetical protein PHI97_07545 [Desulfobulbus sp.]|nr:hypothetical protein [Desulfobulbus sp.]